MPKMPQVENQWKAERERLAGELQRLEEALSDARTGSGDNEDGSLVSKLRDATKKRVRIEEEFERSSDRWREERRNLTDEIDQLDRALAKARAEARQSQNGSQSDESALRRELNEAIENQERVEKNLAAERAEWDSARSALNEKVAKLENSLVEALERANNTARTDEAQQATLKAQLETQKKAIEAEVRQKFQSSLEDTQKAVQTLEDERAQLHLEIHRLQEAVAKATATQPTPVPAESPAVGSRFSLRKLRKGRAAENEAAPDPVLTERIAELEQQLSKNNVLRETAIQRAETAEAELAELEARRKAEGSGAATEEREARTATWEEERRELTGRLEILSGELESATKNTRTLEQQLATLEAAATDASHGSGSAQESLLADLQAQAASWTAERETLTARIAEAEKALGEARENATSNQNELAEIQGQIESRDTEISDLKAASESDLKGWEQERKELAARLEALETQLGEAEKHSSGSVEAVSTLEAALEASRTSLAELESKRQAEAEEWSREREQLVANAGELEFKLADTQSGHADLTHQYEQLQAEFEEARRAGNELREQMGVDVREWSDEQKALKKQVKELTASLKDARDADSSADAKTRKLVSKLEAAEEQLVKVSEEWTTDRKTLETSVRDLERKLGDAEKAAQSERQSAEEARQSAEEARQSAEEARQSAEEARQSAAEELQKAASEIATLITAGETATREVETLRAAESALRQQFDNEKQALGSAQEALIARVGELEAELTASRETEAALRGQLESEKAELSSVNDALTGRVRELELSVGESAQHTQQQAAELNAALEEAQRALMSAQEEARTRSGEWDAERSALETQVNELNGELRKLRKAQSADKSLTGANGGPGRSGKSVADLEARRQALEVRLLESEDSKDELAAALKAATDEWEAERSRLRAQLGEMDEAIETASKKDRAELDERQAGLIEKLNEAEEKYSSLEEQSLKSAKAWDEQRAQLEQEIAQWEQQVVAEAERVAEETKQALQAEYDMQLRELRSQKEHLETQLQSGGSAGPGVETDPAVINEEMARVDAEIDEINQLIEDPNAALSNVMRKNAERSELKAYRRGLSYLAERLSRESEAS